MTLLTWILLGVIGVLVVVLILLWLALRSASFVAHEVLGGVIDVFLNRR